MTRATAARYRARPRGSAPAAGALLHAERPLGDLVRQRFSGRQQHPVRNPPRAIDVRRQPQPREDVSVVGLRWLEPAGHRAPRRERAPTGVHGPATRTSDTPDLRCTRPARSDSRARTPAAARSPPPSPRAPARVKSCGCPDTPINASGPKRANRIGQSGDRRMLVGVAPLALRELRFSPRPAAHSSRTSRSAAGLAR